MSTKLAQKLLQRACYYGGEQNDQVCMISHIILHTRHETLHGNNTIGQLLG